MKTTNTVKVNVIFDIHVNKHMYERVINLAKNESFM